MAGYRHPAIAREGWGVVGAFAIVAFLVWWRAGELAALPVFLLTLFLLYLFRDPLRKVPSRPLGVVSPLDGRVSGVCESRDPFLERPRARRVSLRLSPLGVRSLRCPIEGRVMERWSKTLSRAGTQVVAYWIRTDEDDDLVWTLIGPRRWIRLTLQPGERVGQGQRCGFTYLPVISQLYLPLASRVLVHPGQRVKAGEAVLAEFVHRQSQQPVAGAVHAV